MTADSDVAGAPVQAGRALGPHYKWIALSNTTLGMLMATINQSIVLIALPDIFRGIGLNPLSPGNTSYLLWMFMGFLVVSAVLVVSFGRLGDMFGRVRMYTLGFAIFSVASIFLTVTWMHGADGAMWLIIWRVVQGIGGAFLFANAAAIVTDAFPANQRGTALSVNSIAAIAGSFIGLILGGVLAPVNWHLIFLVSAPIGVLKVPLICKSRPHAPQPSQGRARGDDERPRLYGGPMASVKQIQVTFDSAEPERVARFWCEVLGYVVPPPPEGFATWDDFDRALPPEHQGSAFACIDPSGAGPRLFFQRVPEGKVVKNRLHLDVRVGTGLVGEERLAALEAECARLVALGAVRVRLLLADGGNESCLVMQDIEGNEFCLD